MLSYTLLLSRHSQNPFGVPSGRESLAEARERKTSAAAPIGEAKCDAVKRKIAIAAHIPSLFVACRPVAVVRRVALGVVDALYLAALWSRPHVYYEGVERAPSVAYSDTPTSVVRIVLAAMVRATLEHRGPRRIFRGSFTAACGSVCCASHASATLGASIFEVTSESGRAVSAIAHASPPNVGCSPKGDVVGPADNGDATESLSGQIPQTWMRYSLFSHAVPSFAGDGVVSGWRSLPTGASRVPNYPTSTVAARPS